MHAIASPPLITPSDRLGMTVFVAITLHAIVILGVSFVHEDPDRRRTDTLDVVLVQHRSERAPEDPDYLAQASQDGGGETAEKARPATPVPAPFTAPRPEIAAAAPPVEPGETLALTPAPAAPVAPDPPPEPPRPEKAEQAPPAPAPRPVLSRPQPSPRKVAPTRPADKPEPRARPKLEPSKLTRARPEPQARKVEASEPRPAKREAPERENKPPPSAPATPTRTLSAAALVSRSMAMASLNAEIDRKLRAYAKRPRRKWITARTREHKYAAYMEAWRAKVERVGNLNYPDVARRKRLSGNLLLDVALNPDGSVHEIVLRRSSGKKVLDDAAVRIVKLASPFSKFPRSIAQEVDILHIQRTWLFLSEARFASR